jgi:hypothetical protein
MDSCFFACGGFFVTKGALQLAIPVASGISPIGDPNDHVWKYVSFVFAAFLFGLKFKSLTGIAAKEIERIKNTQPSYWFNFFDWKKGIVLFSFIGVFVIIQHFTSQFYASRLIYMTTPLAAGPLIGYNSFPLMKSGIFWSAQKHFELDNIPTSVGTSEPI